MYVALTELRLTNRLAKVGDELPELDSWDQKVINAHLNLHRIKWVADKPVAPISKVKQPKKAPVAAPPSAPISKKKKPKGKAIKQGA